MTLISTNSLPDQNDKTRVIECALAHANEPKEVLCGILRNLERHGLRKTGIYTQLDQIVADLEAWQNR